MEFNQSAMSKKPQKNNKDFAIMWMTLHPNKQLDYELEISIMHRIESESNCRSINLLVVQNKTLFTDTSKTPKSGCHFVTRDHCYATQYISRNTDWLSHQTER